MMLMAVARAAAQAPAPAPETRVVVSIPDCKLAVVENGRVVKIFDTAVGAPQSPSPNGTFKIVARVALPTYYHSGKVIPPGPHNPLGTRWMGLSAKGYGIHGTNMPQSIGHAASHGCIRMRKHDIEELFAMLHVGDVVELHGERDELVTRIFNTEAPTLMAAAGPIGGGR
jgi:lipoprotein-anchoring transpeptidase ErfK/SrfK